MNGRYRAEADALDARIRTVIENDTLDVLSFDALACDIFSHQFTWNAPYAAYARSLGVTERNLPRRDADIPAVPAAAFKDAVLSTVGGDRATTYFETSGTTQARSGRHYLESVALYECALLAGFDRGLLTDQARLRYLLLVPDVRAHPQSSLGHMMDVVARERGDGNTAWYVRDDALDGERFVTDVHHACAHGIPVCVATTAFALVAVLDELDRRGVAFELPAGSRVMETGGFKGRVRVVARDELYARTARAFGIDESSIVAEYGMTELSSQYYDSHASRTSRARVKAAPPWLRPIVVDAGGNALPDGVVGTVRHIDCANRSSVIAIDTEDLGALTPGGLILVGRDEGAALRGCSLDAEDLVRG